MATPSHQGDARRAAASTRRIGAADSKSRARLLDAAWTSPLRAESAAQQAPAAPQRIETFTSSFEIGAGEVVRPFVTEPRRAPLDDTPAVRPPIAPPADGPDRSGPADDLEDSDLIVIEDDPPAPMPTHGRPQVRRQEYRQLFAKLRGG